MNPVSPVPLGSPLVITLDSIHPVPWKNGGGVTRELLAHPRQEGSAWHYRISVATIEQDGDFSIFPGVERWFAVLEGAPVTLSIDGEVRTVAMGAAPLHFSGSALTSCRLTQGRTIDLNLMVAKEIDKDSSGAMHTVWNGHAWHPHLSGAISVGLFAANAGTCQWTKSHDLPPQHLDVKACTLLWFFDAPAALDFKVASTSQNGGWWMEVYQ